MVYLGVKKLLFYYCYKKVMVNGLMLYVIREGIHSESQFV